MTEARPTLRPAGALVVGSLGGRQAVRPRVLRLARLACAVYGLASVVFAVGLYRQAGYATRIWPWPDDRLTYVYLASLAAAIAAPFLWVAWSGELATLAPVALVSLVVNAGVAIYLAIRAATTDDRSPLAFAAGSLALAVGSGLVFRWVRRIPPRDGRATPRPVRRIMAGLGLLVGVISVGLLGRVDGLFPWDLRPETSTMFGIVYLGVAVYFAYAALHPAWPMTTGQLLGFVAYTTVLVKPYLDLLGDRLADEPSGTPLYGSYAATSGGAGPNMLSLTVFLTILAFGTAPGVWTLVVRRETRIIGRPVAA